MPVDRRFTSQHCEQPKTEDEMSRNRYGITKTCKKCKSERSKHPWRNYKKERPAKVGGKPATRSFTLTCPKCGHEIAGLK